MAVFGLIDGNAFYCSCQRAFEPRLKQRPVVVLSNNDGCAIARTQEAKSLGIKMGEPWHLARKHPKNRDVIWYSSNYALYADMSQRMYEVLSARVPSVEAYSIDEMFLDLSNLPYDLNDFCKGLRDDIRHHVKIPTCIGWGPTKTIAKLANALAKEDPQYNGLCDLTDPDQRKKWYKRLSIDEVWGIGRKVSEKLKRQGVTTIADFVALDPHHTRSLLTVVGARVQAELKGQSCLGLSDVLQPRKGIVSSRSFGVLLTEWEDIREALALFAHRAAETLRREDLQAAHLSVMMRTNPHNGDPWYAPSASLSIEPTSDTRDLIRIATSLAQPLWRSGFRYAKAGISLNDLRPIHQQPSLFASRSPEKSLALMEAMDAINARYGRDTLRPASTKIQQGWRPRAGMLSPRYTTCLDEILRVQT
ncbi:Y-family DNA polymerase [Swingsia samuiensis]|uniref:DNA-directed DNA polymerase n=1 Tax=Swingsia samuiensis TaxID=1293412 RepID=A0A4Y6UN63_9PROT|nr:Y-family DNA polymerase [Swingsia samuiensis]QDH18108.1 Y-family DNA polymerase [Swingsia samuiensis]